MMKMTSVLAKVDDHWELKRKEDAFAVMVAQHKIILSFIYSLYVGGIK